jgi:integrase
MTDLVLSSHADLAAAVHAVALDAKSDNTKRAYASAEKRFAKWLSDNSLTPSVEALCAYLVNMAGHGASISTIHVARAAALYNHVSHIDSRHPLLKDTIAGLERRQGVAPKGAKDALVSSSIGVLITAIPSGITGSRDRAIILLGFAGAYRRSELCAIRLADITFEPRGMRIITRKSKTDQRGKGHEKAILRGESARTCPVVAVEGWIELAGLSDGPLFRRVSRFGSVGDEALTPGSVAVIVKERAEAAGLKMNVSGHSLRSGFVSSAAEAGKSLDAIMAVTAHKSYETVRRYIQRADLFKNHAGSGLL